MFRASATAPAPSCSMLVRAVRTGPWMKYDRPTALRYAVVTAATRGSPLMRSPMGPRNSQTSPPRTAYSPKPMRMPVLRPAGIHSALPAPRCWFSTIAMAEPRTMPGMMSRTWRVAAAENPETTSGPVRASTHSRPKLKPKSRNWVIATGSPTRSRCPSTSGRHPVHPGSARRSLRRNRYRPSARPISEPAAIDAGTVKMPRCSPRPNTATPMNCSRAVTRDTADPAPARPKPRRLDAHSTTPTWSSSAGAIQRTNDTNSSRCSGAAPSADASAGAATTTTTASTTLTASHTRAKVAARGTTPFGRPRPRLIAAATWLLIPRPAYTAAKTFTSGTYNARTYKASALIRAISATMPTRTSRPNTSAAAIGSPRKAIARVSERRSGPGTAHASSRAGACSRWSTMIRPPSDDVLAHEQSMDVAGALHELQAARVPGELVEQRVLEPRARAEEPGGGQRDVFGEPGRPCLGGAGEAAVGRIGVHRRGGVVGQLTYRVDVPVDRIEPAVLGRGERAPVRADVLGCRPGHADRHRGEAGPEQVENAQPAPRSAARGGQVPAQDPLRRKGYRVHRDRTECRAPQPDRREGGHGQAGVARLDEDGAYPQRSRPEPGEHDAELGPGGVAHVPFRAGQHEPVAVRGKRGAQVYRVRTPVRLGEGKEGPAGRPVHPAEEPLLLRRVAEQLDERAGHRCAGRGEQRAEVAVRQLLHEDNLFQHGTREAPPTVDDQRLPHRVAGAPEGREEPQHVPVGEALYGIRVPVHVHRHVPQVGAPPVGVGAQCEQAVIQLDHGQSSMVRSRYASESTYTSDNSSPTAARRPGPSARKPLAPSRRSSTRSTPLSRRCSQGSSVAGGVAPVSRTRNSTCAVPASARSPRTSCWANNGASATAIG